MTTFHFYQNKYECRSGSCYDDAYNCVYLKQIRVKQMCYNFKIIDFNELLFHNKSFLILVSVKTLAILN